MQAFPTGILLVLLSSASAQSALQQPAPPQTFEAADVHPAPFVRTRFTSAGFPVADRWIAHQANLVDLIAYAWNIDRSVIQGGPAWLEFNRYEIVARIPPKTDYAAMRPMMKALLVERFHLAVHTGTAPLPAYLLSTPPGSTPKMKASTSTDPGAQFCPQRMSPAKPDPDVIPAIEATCTNMTMEFFAAYLRNISSDYLTKPVVDRTGLKGGWDFTYRWNFKGSLAKAGSSGISVFDAVDKQLGLKLELKTSPLPTLIVDSALETPTPNAPDLAKRMPPQAPPQFDVATIKPYQATGPLIGNQGFLGSGGGAPVSRRYTRDQVDFRGVPVRWLIVYAWQLDDEDPEVIVNPPKWLDTERWDIAGKVVFDPALGPNQYINDDDLRLMFRTLLADRFKLESHLATQDYTGYTLSVAEPRLKPAADPTARARCGDDVFPIAKDPRLPPSARNLLVQCQNMTMPQFTRELSTMVGYYMHRPPLDATGLKGTYDFTLNFSSANKMPWWTGPSPTGAQGPPSTEPDNAISMYDAVRAQLGLKLTKDRHPGPVLVIDKIQQTPTEN